MSDSTEPHAEREKDRATPDRADRSPRRAGRLEGRVAIVTGAARGLGRAIAEVYAEEGAAVVVADVAAAEGERTAAGITSRGGEAVFVHTDVRESESVANVVATAEERFGRLDVMTANAAALPRVSAPPPEGASAGFLGDEDLAFLLDVNFGGAWRCFHHAIPALRRAGGGSMTATASIVATSGWAGSTATSAAKGAIVATMRSLVAELGESIRVNVVAPGMMATGIVEKSALEAAEDLPDWRKGALLWSRWAEPREVALCHLFLASDEASFVNGHLLVADGGQTAVVAGTPPFQTSHEERA